jgi:nucleotide-binding universal stress UspA family protein
VIATDASAASAEAPDFDFELELAADEDAIALLVHVAPRFDAPPAGGFPTNPTIPHEISEADRVPLEDAEQVAKRAGVAATTHLLVGDPAREIASYADSEDGDMIVVGSRGQGAIASALLGSVSRGVLREPKRPVLVVRGRAATETEAGDVSAAAS